MSLSENTANFLEQLLSEDEKKPCINDLTDEIKDDLKIVDDSSTVYRPDNDITLYRAVNEDDDLQCGSVTFKDFSFWTYNLEVATNNNEGCEIIQTTVAPENVFFDTITINLDFCGGDEIVVLKPGTYDAIEVD